MANEAEDQAEIISPARRALLAGVAAALGAASAAKAQEGPIQGQRPAPGGTTVSLMANGFKILKPPIYSDAIMNVTNLHEFEDVGKRNISAQAYDYIRAGTADDLTMKANREAYGDYWIRRRIMTDVSNVDCSVELFGRRYPHPVILGPVGLRRLLHPDGDRLTILAAQNSGAILVGPRLDLIEKLKAEGPLPVWWGAALGHKTRAEAEEWVKRNEAAGASALTIAMDYPYTGLRDVPSRNEWEAQWSSAPIARFNSGEGEIEFQAAMTYPYFPAMRWEWFDWVRNSTKLPIIAKGVTTGEDALKAVKAGADGISVSNHGGRTLDGAQATLHALPDVVNAVGNKVPVLVDGGIRRGGDVLKAAALGARAIMIGRPYLWALAAFGQDGVQRCVEMLAGETRIALGLSGAGTFDKVDRSMIRSAWKPYTT